MVSMEQRVFISYVCTLMGNKGRKVQAKRIASECARLKFEDDKKSKPKKAELATALLAHQFPHISVEAITYTSNLIQLKKKELIAVYKMAGGSRNTHVRTGMVSYILRVVFDRAANCGCAPNVTPDDKRPQFSPAERAAIVIHERLRRHIQGTWPSISTLIAWITNSDKLLCDALNHLNEFWLDEDQELIQTKHI